MPPKGTWTAHDARGCEPDRDPYDEGTALRLIDALWAAGRLGEATRHHHRYAERMRELGVPVRALRP